MSEALADQNVPSSPPFCETASANAAALRMAVAGPTAVDVLRVEHVYRTEGGADRGDQGVDIGFGASGDDRAG